MNRRSTLTPATKRLRSVRLKQFFANGIGRRLLLAILTFTVVLLAALWLVPLPDRVKVDYSVTVYSDEGVLMRPYLAPGDVWRFPISIDRLPPFAIPALLAREDKRFYDHFGVDPIAVVRAIRQNFSSGRVISGASTITMQLARLLEPRGRSLTSKLIEAFRALQLELRVGKEEILRLYLSYAPYGGNIEGISAASYVYFGHAPEELSAAEMAVLLLLPQSPSRWGGYSRNQWLAARNRVLDELLAKNVITARQHRQSREESIPLSRRSLPLRAPHFSDYLRDRFPEEHEIHATLSMDVQRVVERVAARIRPEYEALGVHNVSILVVENRTRKLRAAVGNFDYLDHHDGQSFNSFDVPRSPGSTLKPFLYAMAIERGLLLPQTLLRDVPVRYNGYEPGNFSGQYVGLITAEKALSQSLNVPFVRLLKKVGMDYFLEYLEQGVPWRFDRDAGLGLSIIIGGVELTPLQLIQPYVNLAQKGVAAPVRIVDSGEEPVERPWLSEGAVALLEQALSRRDRPDFPVRKKFSRFNPDIRWKTGTSQGRRDAWSIGYNQRYTTLVWFGNMDQDSSPFLTGADAAAPVMFEVLEALHGQKSVSEPRMFDEEEFVDIEVCSFSGDTPTRDCPNTRKVTALKRSPLLGSCRFHHRALVDKESGLRVMKGCDSGKQTAQIHVLQLPPLVRRWYGGEFGSAMMMPAYHPDCSIVSTEKGRLTIVQPKDNEEYILLPSFGASEALVSVDIESSAGLDKAVCFLNGKQTRADSITGAGHVLRLPEGDYHLFCSNDHGASDETSFFVRSASN